MCFKWIHPPVYHKNESICKRNMEKVQNQQLKLKCPKQNQATHACANFQCQKSPLTCSKQQCQCKTYHSTCAMQTQISKLKNQLETKGKSYSIILQEIYKWYQNQLKSISIEMQELKKIIDLKEIILYGNQNRLYTLMNGEKQELILPQLVNYVLKSIQKQPVPTDVKKTLEQTKQQLQQSQAGLRTILQNVKHLTQAKQKIAPFEGIQLSNIKFIHDMHHPNIGILNNCTIKVMTAGTMIPALIEPAIFKNNYRSCKVNFRIKQLAANTGMFGICQTPPDFKVTDTEFNNKIQNGSFTLDDTTICIGKAEGHRKQNSSVSVFSADDQVQVEYERQTEKVTVRNTTKNTQSISYIKTNKEQPVYFAVLLSTANDSVEIIEGKYTQGPAPIEVVEVVEVVEAVQAAQSQQSIPVQEGP